MILSTSMLAKPRRRLLLFIVSMAVIALGAFHFLSLRRIEDISTDFTTSGFNLHDSKLREQLHFSKYKFSLTDGFEREVGGWDAFAAKPQKHKCLSFFKFLDKKLPDWKTNYMNNQHFQKNIVRKGDFFNFQLELIANRKNNNDPPEEITEEDKTEVNDMFNKALKDTMSTEQGMADTITIIRIFGHCFFSEPAMSLDADLRDIYNRYSAKTIPFFHPEVPLTSSGDIDTNSEWPFDSQSTVDEDNLLDYYYRNMKGTGIVLSTATKHSRDVVKFIHVLRALGNPLPIQVMYRSDLSTMGRQAILLAGSSSKEELLGDEMTEIPLLRRSLEKAGISFSEITEMEFPKQNITLVNMKKPLSRVVKNDFSSYNNKILALFFNSFEKVLLFDTDVVPLLSTKSLQTLKEFTDTGALFFRDRTLMDRNDWIETNYFAKLMPHKTNKIDIAMGIKPVTEHTLGNMYMKGWRHYQEAGLVILDRKRHFRSLLTIFPLTIWSQPITSSIWGDKEMYWLAMSIAGDEDYAFNEHGAASVGEITSPISLKLYNNTVASELCSSHPGHISGDGQLLWINSGFSYCKKNGFARDKSKFPFSTFEQNDMRELYENPLKIRHAVIPPELPALRTPNGSPDLSMELNFIAKLEERKKDVDQIPDANQIDSYNPQKGWVKSRTCSDYQYCAYNIIESLDGSGKLDETGLLFQFDAETYKNYDILGAIWASSLRTSKLTEKAKERSSDSEGVRDLNNIDASTPEADPRQSAKANESYESPLVNSSLTNGSWEEGNNQKEVGSKVGNQSAVPVDSDSMQHSADGHTDASKQMPQPSSKSEIHYDPSRVRERPEKFQNDVKELLSKLASSGW
ncbi:hypothetical protein JCM33374_g2798 [Metschnikowia sp. JCM 33374]|nr:hypothetical protein JCM33374_g2798 [Metschnikowia sp. JCM 33374]